MLSSVFKFCLPELSSSFIINEIIHSFELERPSNPVGPPAWDLTKVFAFLQSSTFKPLRSRLSRLMTMKVLFLLSTATAKRVGELQAPSVRVTLHGDDLSLCCLPNLPERQNRSIIVLRVLWQILWGICQKTLFFVLYARSVFIFDLSLFSLVICVSLESEPFPFEKCIVVFLTKGYY